MFEELTDLGQHLGMGIAVFQPVIAARLTSAASAGAATQARRPEQVAALLANKGLAWRRDRLLLAAAR